MVQNIQRHSFNRKTVRTENLFCAEMRKIVKRNEIAVKKAAAVFRTIMISALLLGWKSTCMDVQAADETQAQTEMTAEEARTETALAEMTAGTLNESQEQADSVSETKTAEESTEVAEQPEGAMEEAQAQTENTETATDQTETAEETVQPLSVTMVGDSVMLGASPSLLGMMPDCVIDAKVSRQLVQADVVLDSLEAQGLLRQTVVMGLGTNGPFSVAKGQELIDRLGSGRMIYWITVYGRELSWQEESNATIRQLAAQNENVHIIDWSQAVSGHPEWLCGDGIHLSAAGREAYANIVLGGLQ